MADATHLFETLDCLLELRAIQQSRHTIAHAVDLEQLDEVSICRLHEVQLGQGRLAVGVELTLLMNDSSSVLSPAHEKGGDGPPSDQAEYHAAQCRNPGPWRCHSAGSW